MTAGWDNLVPRWFTRLDPRCRTPVNSILFVAALVMCLILLSMLGVHEQEASQLLANASHRALRHRLCRAVRAAAGGRRCGSRAARLVEGGVGRRTRVEPGIVSVVAVYPIVDVVSKAAYAAKICGRGGD